MARTSRERWMVRLLKRGREEAEEREREKVEVEAQ